MCVSIYITGDDGGENYVVIMMTPVAYILAVVITIIKKGRKGGERSSSRSTGPHRRPVPHCRFYSQQKNKIV